MSEESIKRQRRELAEAAFERFRPFGFRREVLTGDPFDLRIFRPGCPQEWLLRCVPAVTKKDQEAVRDDSRPAYCIKGIVFRLARNSKRIQFLEIE